ncbi:MAG TPA: hypothetical protein VGN05_06645 [Parvibaculum sp.]|jgi:hypothetical protein
MATFIVKSLISLAVVATLWGPAEAWLGSQHRAGLACTTDFSACRVAGKVIPLVDRSSVLGGIAAQARRGPAGQLKITVSEMASVALEGVRGAALPKE